MPKRKPVLLSQAQSDLKAIVSTDESRTIRYLHATSEFVEATDGFIMLRVPHDDISVDEFPAIKGSGVGLTGESVLLDPKVLEKAFKNTIKKGEYPVLSFVHLSLGEAGEPLLSATDLETEVTIRQKKSEETYPDTSAIWPQSSHYVFTLGAVLLGKIADWAIKHGKSEGIGSTVRFFAQAPDRPIKIQIRRPDGDMAEGVIMPIRESVLMEKEKTAQALWQAAVMSIP